MYRIIDTTDNKYEGELIDALPKTGELFEYRGTKFIVDKVIVSGDTVTIVCSNYIVVLTKEK